MSWLLQARMISIYYSNVWVVSSLLQEAYKHLLSNQLSLLKHIPI